MDDNTRQERRANLRDFPGFANVSDATLDEFIDAGEEGRAELGLPDMGDMALDPATFGTIVGLELDEALPEIAQLREAGELSPVVAAVLERLFQLAQESCAKIAAGDADGARRAAEQAAEILGQAAEAHDIVEGRDANAAFTDRDHIATIILDALDHGGIVLALERLDIDRESNAAVLMRMQYGKHMCETPRCTHPLTTVARELADIAVARR